MTQILVLTDDYRAFMIDNPLINRNDVKMITSGNDIRGLDKDNCILVVKHYSTRWMNSLKDEVMGYARTKGINTLIL